MIFDVWCSDLKEHIRVLDGFGDAWRMGFPVVAFVVALAVAFRSIATASVVSLKRKTNPTIIRKLLSLFCVLQFHNSAAPTTGYMKATSKTKGKNYRLPLSSEKPSPFHRRGVTVSP
jgi:hypothetical protein